MERKLFGFLIDERIIFDIGKRKIIHYNFDEYDLPMFFKAASLNETQSRLLRHLLVNSQRELIDKSEIMYQVWDECNLSSSSQRLWQSMNSIRKKLSYFGVSDDFIINVHGAGYRVDKSKVLFLLVN